MGGTGRGSGGLSADAHRLWFGGGAGYGSAQTCYDLGCGERKDSQAGYLQAGYTLGDYLLAGGEFGFWSKTYQYPRPEDYARVRMYQLTGVAMYYPRRAGLFVKGGAGLAFIDSFAQVSATKLDADLGSGFGFVVGGGYDFPVGPIAVTPAFKLLVRPPG